MSSQMKPSILCVDVGTSSIKAGLIDLDGKLLWSNSTTMFNDQRQLESWDPLIWNQSLVTVLSTFSSSGFIPSALVLSGNGPTIVPLDSNYQPVGPALLWLDGKRETIAGTKSYYLPKINWLRIHQPQIFEKVRSFVSCPEYLYGILGGNSFTISPHEQFTPAIWTPDDIKAYGLDASTFPVIVGPGKLVGKVRESAASMFGLPVGLPLYTGGSDFLMSLAGSGTVEPGQTCDRAGSSEGINYCSNRVISDDKLRTLPHVIPGLWNIAGILPATGLMFEWFRTVTGQKSRSYEQILSDIRLLPPQGDYPLFLPDPTRPGSGDFTEGRFLGLKRTHGAAELGRGVVESIGFSVRMAVERLRAADCPVESLRVCGGQAKNRCWLKLKADITGVPLEVPAIRDAELTGDAIMGFIGLGEFANIREAANSLVHIESYVKPDQAVNEIYADRYQTWLQSAYNKI